MFTPVNIRKASALAMVLACSVALSSCAKDTQTTGSVTAGAQEFSFAQLTMPELNEAVRRHGERYQNDATDKQTGLAYGTLLRMTGRDEQALAVMRKLVIHHPDDNEILAAYAKALAATGNLPEALDALRRAQKPEQPDWRLLSAQGAILDQLDKSAEARRYYRRALEIIPEEPSVLSNLGMSYLLTNDLSAAESYLRKAIAQPGADSLVRQNLALVVGLQGRFSEAERIAAAELPPAEAKANIAYLRDLLAQQNAWSQLEDIDSQKNAE
jgi:Flp pilus assembly protein TadD